MENKGHSFDIYDLTSRPAPDDMLRMIDWVCMDCPRPPAWDGGEEECDRCMVRKQVDLIRSAANSTNCKED